MSHARPSRPTTSRRSWLAAAAATPWVASLARPLRADEPPAAVLEAERARAAVIARASAATVAVLAPGGSNGGSGVLISPDGYALTNFHVTNGCGDFMKCGLDDGRLYDAVVVGLDPVGDVALIRLFGRTDFPVAPLGDSDLLRAGDSVFVAGNPFLLATDFTPTVTAGIVSGVHRYQYPAGTLLEYADCIQTDAAINPGNSGGPLFNARGELVGINGRGSFEKRGRVNVGVGYAISINQIKHFLGHLRGGLICDHATLGARIATDDEGRAVVADILEDSDAYRRGLRYGDELIDFAGRPIRNGNAFKNALGIFPKGWRVPLTYRRDAKDVTIQVRLAGVHGAQELLEKVRGRPQPPAPGPDGPPKPDAPGPDGENPPRPERPIPLPGRPSGPPKPPMPEIIKKHFEARSGYANYHFNRLERDRAWNALLRGGDFSARTGLWTLAGDLAAGGEAEFRIQDDGAGCVLPGGEQQIDATDGLTGDLGPPGSGGLLAALHLWRRLLILGPEKFGGELHYEGHAPVAGHGLMDVLAGMHGGVLSRFLIDASAGRLHALEVVIDVESDPCEILFHDYAPQEDRYAPGRIEVRFGDAPFCDLKLTRFDTPGPTVAAPEAAP